MKKIIYTITAILALVFTTNAMAKDENKVMPSIYVFGVSTSFNDSLVFFTDVMKLDSAWQDGKSGFIYGRGNYSFQLHDYLGRKGYPNRTCIFVSDKNIKNVTKKYEKMKSRYTKKGKCEILLIDKSEFVFTPVEPQLSGGN